MKHDDRVEQDRVTLLAAMEEVTAGLAHELNQPLSAISLYARGSIRRLDSGVELAPGDFVEILENIAVQSQRAGQIIRDARQRTRVDAVVRRALDPATFLDDACSIWKDLAERTGVGFDCEREEGLPDLRIDPSQIRLALGQLLRNAMEAARETTDPRIRISARRAGDRIQLRIQNPTLAVAPADLELWFEPFYTTKPGHLGLGLGISRNLIRLHGGDLVGQRTEDGGLDWVLQLPTVGPREAA